MRLLAGIREGDPLILDSLPSCPLSGEWADGLTPPELIARLPVAIIEVQLDDVLRAYEDAYCGAVVDEVERDCLEHVEPEPDVWQLCESPPAGCDAVASLYHWSANYDAGKGPFSLFADLIGWSADELGEPIYDLADASLGYLELGKLAEALTEYADRPHDVRGFVEQLIAAEGR